VELPLHLMVAHAYFKKLWSADGVAALLVESDHRVAGMQYEGLIAMVPCYLFRKTDNGPPDPLTLQTGGYSHLPELNDTGILVGQYTATGQFIIIPGANENVVLFFFKFYIAGRDANGLKKCPDAQGNDGFVFFTPGFG
jgi:hypothetical protein